MLSWGSGGRLNMGEEISVAVAITKWYFVGFVIG